MDEFHMMLIAWLVSAAPGKRLESYAYRNNVFKWNECPETTAKGIVNTFWGNSSNLLHDRHLYFMFQHFVMDSIANGGSVIIASRIQLRAQSCLNKTYLMIEINKINHKNTRKLEVKHSRSANKAHSVQGGYQYSRKFHAEFMLDMDWLPT